MKKKNITIDDYLINFKLIIENRRIIKHNL